MKPDLDKRYIYAGVALLIILSVIGIVISLTQNNGNPNGAMSTEASTEQSSEISSEESTSEAALENEYFYKRPENQNRVLAIRALEESQLPAPYDFTQYGLKNYKDRRFYALVIIEFAKHDQPTSETSTESITEMARLEIISELDASHIEQVYNQLEIRYEEDYAIFQYDHQFNVTSLIEPKLYRNYLLYDLEYTSESTPETTTIGVYKSSFTNVMFSTTDKLFLSEPVIDAKTEVEDYDWEGKTVNHRSAITSEQGPALSKITTEPRLKQLILGASSSVVFDRLGMPKNFGWISGYYLAYEDLLLFSEMEENGDTLTFQPISTIMYFGDFSIVGIKKGMTFKEVEQIIGVQDVINFSEINELNYPLSVTLKKEGFSISIGFNANFEVADFLIRIDDGEERQVFEPLPNDVEGAFTADAFLVPGIEHFTDFVTGYKNCYFNASVVSSGSTESIDIGFYTYDLSKKSPILVNDQPMKMVFEILNDINPSVVTVGKEDGIIYKIDLNTLEAIPVSGPNYKAYIARGGMIFKASLLSD